MEAEALALGIPTDALNSNDVVLPSNSAERKRVLNILAQRRYRRRRREKQEHLERMVSQRNRHTSSEQPTHDENIESEAPSLSTSPGSDDSGNSLIPSQLAVPISNSSAWTPVDWNDSCFGEEPANLTSLLVNNDDITPTEQLQSSQVQNTTFPDDYHLSVPSLDLLRAAYQIAARLQSTHLLFAGLSAQSIFHTADCSSWIATLPLNLQPTFAQLTTPHHPIIDIIPWPTARTRLVQMYSLPSDLWPKHPDDGMVASLVRLVYDMEDGGVRVMGEDPSDEGAWEVEQVFFEVWWWALDAEVLRNTDRKRRARGLPGLKFEGV